MERLFIMDKKDYDTSFKRFRRPSVRGIIINDGKVGMIYSQKYDYYKFPGGGIESYEDMIGTLLREVREETGLTVDMQSIREFGSVLRVQLSSYSKDTVFEQENFYYLCNVKDDIQSQNLDDYELEEGFTLRYVPPEEAITVNRTHDHYGYDEALIERESRVLECLIDKELL